MEKSGERAGCSPGREAGCRFFFSLSLAGSLLPARAPRDWIEAKKEQIASTSMTRHPVSKHLGEVSIVPCTNNKGTVINGINFIPFTVKQSKPKKPMSSKQILKRLEKRQEGAYKELQKLFLLKQTRLKEFIREESKCTFGKEVFNIFNRELCLITWIWVLQAVELQGHANRKTLKEHDLAKVIELTTKANGLIPYFKTHKVDS